MNLNEWRPGQQPRSLLYCAVTDHTAVAYPGCGALNEIMAVASPFFSTSSIKAKCRDQEAKLPKTKRIVQNVDGSCIAVTADLCNNPIGRKNIDNTQHVVSR